MWSIRGDGVEERSASASRFVAGVDALLPGKEVAAHGGTDVLHG
jgi:hypothetical protein